MYLTPTGRFVASVIVAICWVTIAFPFTFITIRSRGILIANFNSYLINGRWKSKRQFVPHHTSRNSQSIKIGIDLSLDKSIKIVKSDLIDIYCIEQSVEIDDTLVSESIYLDFTDSIDVYRKIHLFFCSSEDENCFHANSCQLSCNWESKDQTILLLF